MTTRSITPLALVTLLLASASIGQAAPRPEQRTDEKDLKKRYDDAAVAVKEEEERVDRLKKSLEKQFAAFTNEAKVLDVAVEVGKAIDKVKGDLGGPNAEKAKKDLADACREIVKDKVGKEMARFIAEPLATHLIETYAAASGATIRILDVFTEFLDDKFNLNDPFEQNFKLVFEPLATEALKKAIVTRDDAKRELDAFKTARSSGAVAVNGMIPVPGGEYVVGFDDAEIQAIAKLLNYEVERFIYAYASSPAHKVKINPFLLGQNEVTNLAYWRFCEETGRKKRPSWWGKDGKYPADFEKRPVVGVTYDDAEAYAAWCGCRLATEEEYEIAARYPGPDDRGKPRIFPWGNTWPKGKIPCHYNGDVNRPEIRNLKADLPALVYVGTFTEFRSALGFNDLAGNASEWTSSPFVAYPGFKDIKKKGVDFHSGEFNESRFSVRGGHFNNNDFCMMAGWRVPNVPDNGTDKVGFRVARSLEPGRDVIQHVAGEHRLDSHLVDYPMVPAEQRAGQRNPAIETEDARLFAGVVWDAWDEKLGCAGQSKSVVISVRKTDQLADMVAIRDAAKKSAAILGVCRVDVPIVAPSLKPGTYAFIFRADKPADKKAGTEAVPEGFVLHPIGVKDQGDVTLPPVYATKISQPPRTKIINDAAKDELECVFALPVKSGTNHSLTMSFKLKTEPGVAAKFR